MKKLVSMIVVLLLLAAFAVAQEAPTRWTPDVKIKFKRVGGTAISPDGKWVAYTVGTPLMEGEKSEFLTHIWLVSDDGKQNFQFTQGEKSCTNPQFSPDGKYLAFTSSRSSDNKNQVWAMRLGGGEAEQLTKAKSGVGVYSW